MNENTNDSGSPHIVKGTTRTEHHDSSAKELFDRFWGDDQ